MIGAAVAAAMTVTLAPVNIEQAYAQTLTMNKEITNPGGEKVKEIQSNENSENTAATRESTSSLSVQEGEDDTPANHREMTFFPPNDRTMFRIVESADASSSAAGGISANIEQPIEQEHE
jgi:hypothetical protein